MAISVQNLLTQKSRKFGASETSADWQQMVVDSINAVLDDLEAIVGVATTNVTTVNDSIQLDAQRFQPVISMGTDFYLQDNSSYTIQSLQGVGSRYKDKLRNTQMSWQKTQTLSPKLGSIT